MVVAEVIWIFIEGGQSYMKITRRDFLKWMVASGVAAGVGKVGIAKAAEVITELNSTPVIWIQAAGCSGCTISFLNMIESNGNGVPTVDKLLTEKISLKYHSTVMASYGEEAMDFITTEPQVNSSNYILIVEGGIPTAENGAYCIIGEKDGKPLTALQGVRELAEKAKHIIALGTCSAFRGVSGMGSNITGVKSVSEILDSSQVGKVINLPGCPTHPYIIAQVILQLLEGKEIQLDGVQTNGIDYRRPLEFYPAQSLHNNTVWRCPLRRVNSNSNNLGLPRTTTLGTCGRCFEEMGCKGRDGQTRVTCYTQYWHVEKEHYSSGMDWKPPTKGCFGAGNICIGCSSPNFPDFKNATTGIPKSLYVK